MTTAVPNEDDLLEKMEARQADKLAKAQEAKNKQDLDEFLSKEKDKSPENFEKIKKIYEDLTDGRIVAIDKAKKIWKSSVSEYADESGDVDPTLSSSRSGDKKSKSGLSELEKSLGLDLDDNGKYK
jgi:DNA invertase Pin-like site-specific DNA recombinase